MAMATFWLSWARVLLLLSPELESNRRNHEHQKYFWNVIVVQEKMPIIIRQEKTKLQARTLIILWFCGQIVCLDLCCDLS